MGKQAREKRQRREEMGVEKKERNLQFQTDLEKACLFIIRWGTYLILFTPLIVNIRFFFPFVAPKTTFFRILVEIILAAFIFLVISNRRYLPKINRLTLALGLFLGIFILTSFSGVNLERSFWSTYERMTGIWTLFHLFAFFLILVSVFKTKKDWEKVLGVAVVVGVLLSLYILRGEELSTRGGGTIGNTSFMAAYLLFDIFFAIILLLAKKGLWQVFSGISLALMLPVLFTSTARGAIISFLGGLFLLVLGYFIFSQKPFLKKMAWGLIGLLVILAVFSAVFQPPFVKDKITTTLGEMQPRFVVWEIGLKGFLERPILGWGPENFKVVFDKHFNPCMFLSECGGEIWFDRVHNIIFDTLVSMGLIGFIGYLAIFVVAIYGLIRVIPQIVERRNIFIPLGMMVLLLVYFVQNLLVFDMINTYLMFFLSLGFISFLTERKKDEAEIVIRRINPALTGLVIILLVFFLWFGNIKPIIAGHFTVRMMSSQNIEAVLDSFQKSLDSFMEKYETREQFAQKISRPAPELREDAAAFQKALALAEAEMEKSIEKNSLDFRPHLFLGELYNSSYRFGGNPEKIKKAEEVLEKALQLSPTNQQGYWHLAETRLAQGRYQEALALLQKAIDLEPKLGRSHWYLAMGYQILGQYQSAKEKIIEADKAGYEWQDNLVELKKGIEIYLALRDDQAALPLYLRALEITPADTNLWAGLSASYANLGQYEKAREAAKRVAEIDPTLSPKTEEFLRSLAQ